jgi:ABC-type multidrug transport system fused ATPase/permease subunit
MDRERLLLEQLKIASELHRHMDQMVWQRFSYFITLNGILVSALTLVWSSDSSNDITLSLIATATIAFFGALVSFVWSKIQKRAQLYHSLRSCQAGRAEELLIESISNKSTSVESQHMLKVYEKRRVEEHEEIMKKIPCSRFGTTPTNTLVFNLAMFLAVLWFIAVLVCIGILSRAVPAPFISPVSIQP